MKFNELKVSPDIVRALDELEIKEATNIQVQAIPMIRNGKDVIGMSRTGSGKTLAFSVPLLENIKKKAGVQVLVLAPTRELAMQISREMGKFGKYLNINIATVFGGVSIGPQIDQIYKAEIVVGTPGRVLDHLGRRTLKLGQIKTLVLDEADKMVDMGFIQDINKILSYTSEDRQILLFGATISDEIAKIRSQHMNEPQVARAEEKVEDNLLEQFYYNLEENEKFSYLVHLLKKEDMNKSIIFCSTKSTVNLIASNLRKNGIKADMVHGDLSQNRRIKVVNDFNNGSLNVMVASAVAARGLDIKDVSHVFNYELPRDPEEYIHRIGRTARAGTYGKAITLLSRRDHDSFGAIKSRYRVNIQSLEKDNFEKLRFEARSYSSPRDNNGPRRFNSGPRRSFDKGSSFRGRR
ncbi:MAG: DEAD/DEAH box helicase [Nanoarchaeota archaeon]|nr:DEAD/DEAH box helicase [Nanoarchaeota archaeon]